MGSIRARVLWICIPIAAIVISVASGMFRREPVRATAHQIVRDGKVAGAYEIAVGKPDTPTPTGEFRITDKQSHPGPPGGVFGARWLEFYRVTTRDGVLHLYGIHGTNAPQKLGGAVSHGCIRLSNHDVEEVYREAYIGEPVEIDAGGKR
jgi:lipoprotein-anchoring transpeptidase ErfK/SrfK